MIQNATLFSVEYEEHYGLMHQLQTVRARQSLNPLIEPYQDALKKYIPKIAEMNSMTYQNLCTLKDGWKELAHASKATASAIKTTALTAARHAALSSFVKGGVSDVVRLANLTFDDWKNSNLSQKEFEQRLVHNTSSAYGSIIMGPIGAAAGAAIGAMIDPRLGTVVGTIIGNPFGGTVGAKLSHSVRKIIAKMCLYYLFVYMTYLCDCSIVYMTYSCDCPIVYDLLV